jgi:hypothetical protein
VFPGSAARDAILRVVLYVVVFAVSVFSGSLVLLGLLTLRTFRQVKALVQTVGEASERIAAAAPSEPFPKA